MKRIVALAGRPNTGKTTLFNALTGMRQRVANFAGCTVEKAVGSVAVAGADVEIVDLPGTHSLLPDTEDEKVAFRFLAECAADGTELQVLCVADASNLAHDLALAGALKAAGYPVAVVVNMIDEARLNGILIDGPALSRRLGVPVAMTAARDGEGLDAVMTMMEQADSTHPGEAPLDLRTLPRRRLRALQEAGLEVASEACAAAVTLPPRAVLPTIARSIRIDRVLLHPIAGPLILATVLFLLFQALFSWARPLMNGLSMVLVWAASELRARLHEGFLTSLLCDGVLPGVSAVAVFLPQIAILFLLLGFFESCGYLPRAGAMIDRALRPFGLDGKVLIPFLSGFACAIPGIMSARTIASERRRLVAILLTPLMTCSARLPVYALIITAFVPETFRPVGLNGRGAVMAAMYVFGVALALGLALILKWTGFSDGVMAPATVLPPYRLPRVRELTRYVWTRCWHFLSNAGQVIMLVSVVLWALASYPRATPSSTPLSAPLIAARQIEASFLGRGGRAIEPIFRPLGWDWRVSVAVLSSLAAREVFVGTLGTIYALGREPGSAEGLIAAMRDAHKPDGSPRYGVATAAGILVFFAIALQCVSTIAVVRRETGGWKWPAIQFTALFILAYGLAYAAVRLSVALV